MRIKLTLNHQPNQALPFNYNYLISAWIYKTLARADKNFAEWLHEQGFGFGGKRFKLFTFSTLQPRWFDIDKRNRLFILSKPPTVLELSFFIDQTVQHLITGLFQDQKFSIGDKWNQVDFEVDAIEILPKPFFKPNMRFKAITPIFISKNIEGNKNAQFLSPDDPDYKKIFIENLVRKQSAYQLINEPIISLNFHSDLKILSRPRSKMLNIKGSNKRGFLYDFEISAPEELVELGYFAGFGGQNSAAGMGMVRLIN